MTDVILIILALASLVAATKLLVYAVLLPLILIHASRRGLKETAALGVVRSIASVFALLAYAFLGLLAKQTTSLPWIVPGVLVAFPLGHWLAKRIGVATFRRVCTSISAYLVSFGLAHALVGAGIDPAVAYQVMVVTAVVDGRLLWTFFRPDVRRALQTNSAPALGEPQSHHAAAA